MPASLILYRTLTGLLHPILGPVLKQRIKVGKEEEARAPERFGRSAMPRPSGKLIWMHGASVGETSLLLSVANRLLARSPDLSILMTSQTLTSARMIAARAPQNIIHQMAPLDSPFSVRRFFKHWKPDAGVFAEGEIWPNLIHAARKRKVPLALINARMTDKSLVSWKRRRSLAKNLFGAFAFIGAADEHTALGLEEITGHPVDAIGNLKLSISPPRATQSDVVAWRAQIDQRPVLLAASTHEGEEAMAIDAFLQIRGVADNPLLIIAPRHPDRAPDICRLLEARELTLKQRSQNTTIGCEGPVLLADTIGEIALWMELSHSIYLGGANKPDVGGHNPIEPLQLKKPIFSGPHAFNFRDLMVTLEACDAVKIGEDADALAQFWRDCLSKDQPLTPDWRSVESVFESITTTLDATMAAIDGLLQE